MLNPVFTIELKRSLLYKSVAAGYNAMHMKHKYLISERYYMKLIPKNMRYKTT